ncbi:MAG: hypothetical protein XE10_0612 [Methanoculleus marisnigri]|jgi:hypothetical protein|uniref:Uncharacterized protein n=1 Tax=Methanoculleus marisnigri TaxID=2198 RepID=A0A117LRK0_9EURY|nr:hypothetical protein [Methanoculleus marisnigri]KUK63384.1 MAG: hypothetical protein XD82_0348 [Methanoculleus marisnigri]KUL02718.1 MAG: hypothetical protein XE10_0612 [Methanoculleus marisnigri]
MKRIIAAVMIVLLVLPGFAAAASGGEQTGNGEGNPAAGDRQLVRIEENETSGDRVQQWVAENTTPGGKEFTSDRNRVRLAVHALLAAENRTGGIGQNVSAIAREVNNSVEKTLAAEEQIRTRHGFMRFLFGGDAEAARLIEGEAQRNRERVTELRQSIENCTCDAETKTMLREQVRTIEQEQDRLSALAEEEMRARGLFSWG